MDRLSHAHSYVTSHNNGNHFAMVQDIYSGRSGVFTVFVWRVGKTAKIIGRELDFLESRRIIEEYSNGQVRGKHRRV